MGLLGKEETTYSRSSLANRFTDSMFAGYMIPVTLSGIGLAASNVVDSLVLGQQLGEAGLSAIGLAAPLYMLFAIFYVTFAIGGSVLCAEELGAGKSDAANRRFRGIMVLSLATGLIFTLAGLLAMPFVLRLLGAMPGDAAFGYTWQYVQPLLIGAPLFFVNQPLYVFVRGDDDPKTAGFGYVTGNVLDVALCLLFVVVFRMGVAGSIYSTLLGQAASLLILASHFIRKKGALTFGAGLPKGDITVSTWKVGFSSGSQYAASFLFILIMNRILVVTMPGYGVAIFDIVVNISYVALLFFEATANSLATLCASFYGERNRQGMHRVLFLSLRYGLPLGYILAAALFIGARPAAGWFGIGTAALSQCALAIRYYCISCVAAGVLMIGGAYYQATGREKMTYVVSLLRSFAFPVVFALLFAKLPAFLFFGLYPAAEFATLFVFLYLRKKDVFPAAEEMPTEKDMLSFEIRDAEEISGVLAAAEEFCDRHEASMRKSMYLMNAVEEICLSILEHKEEKKGRPFFLAVTLIKEPDGDTFRLCIRDNALEFNPFALRTSRIGEDNAEDEEILANLGVMMVKNKAKDFYYRRFQSFNTMVVII